MHCRSRVSCGVLTTDEWRNASIRHLPISGQITSTVRPVHVHVAVGVLTPPQVYLVHWPVALNPNGNHPVFPTRPNGNRDVDESRDLKETWKDMEALVKKGKAQGPNCRGKICGTSVEELHRQSEVHWRIKLLTDNARENSSNRRNHSGC